MANGNASTKIKTSNQMIHLEKIQEAAENLKDVAVHTPLVKTKT
jgi:threonine dehydratase